MSVFCEIKLNDAIVHAMQSTETYKEYLHTETMRVVAPHIVLGSVALAWAVPALMTRFPDAHNDDRVAA